MWWRLFFFTPTRPWPSSIRCYWKIVLSGAWVCVTLVQSIGTLFKISLSVGKPLPEEILKTLDKIDHPGRLADLIAITLHLGLKEQQEIFETIDPLERLKKVFHHFNREIQSSPSRPHPLLNPGKEAGEFKKEQSLFPSTGRPAE